MRIHPHRRGINDDVKFFTAQRSSPNKFPVNRAREIFSHLLTPGANRHPCAGPRQRERRRPRGPTRTKHQHAASAKSHLSLQRPQHAHIIGIRSEQRPIAANHYGIHRPNLRRQRDRIPSNISESSLCAVFVTLNPRIPSVFHRIQKILPVYALRKGTYTASTSREINPALVQQRRQRMPHGITDHSKNARPPRQLMRAI